MGSIQTIRRAAVVSAIAAVVVTSAALISGELRTYEYRPDKPSGSDYELTEELQGIEYVEYTFTTPSARLQLAFGFLFVWMTLFVSCAATAILERRHGDKHARSLTRGTEE